MQAFGVVEHEWGLYKRQPPRRFLKYEGWRLPSDYVPEGYNLVARVASIAPLVKPDFETWQDVCTRLNTFNRDKAIPGPKILGIDIGAVGFHTTIEGSQTTTKADIMDIDPIFPRAQ